MVSVEDRVRLVKGWWEEPFRCYAVDSSASNFTPVMPQNYLVNSKQIVHHMGCTQLQDTKFKISFFSYCMI